MFLDFDVPCDLVKCVTRSVITMTRSGTWRIDDRISSVNQTSVSERRQSK